MKFLIAPLLFMYAITAAQQPVRELKPSEINPLDLSVQGASKFDRDQELFAKVADKVNSGADPEKLSEEEKRVWDNVDETMGYWDVIGGGCSWYCGGGPKEVSASSTLTAQGSASYKADNAHDLSYKTAWVEGVAGYGPGEFLLYKFAPESPRITEIKIVNGYVKSERAYLDNSRVKKFKLYLNDKPFAILQLDDERAIQTFKFDPIGNGNREDAEALKLQPEWTLKFEILEVYKGLKYDDVAVTEIYFDGIDVH
jgi:hypothetical protein